MSLNATALEVEQFNVKFSTLKDQPKIQGQSLTLVSDQLLVASAYKLFKAPIAKLDQGVSVWGEASTGQIHFLDLISVESAEGEVVIGVTTEGSIYRQVLGDWLFQRVWPTAPQDLPSPLFQLHHINPNELLAIGAFGQLFYSKDLGVSWRDLSDQLDNPDGAHLYGVSQSQTHLTLVGEFGMVFQHDLKNLSSDQVWQSLQVENAYALTQVFANTHQTHVFDNRSQHFVIDWQAEPQSRQVKDLCEPLTPLTQVYLTSTTDELDAQLVFFGNHDRAVSLNVNTLACESMPIEAEQVVDSLLVNGQVHLLTDQGLIQASRKNFLNSP